MSKQLTPENKGKEMALSWARHQLVVTKHKDDEMGSSSCYALFDNRQPTVMFSNFTDDNDNIVDEVGLRARNSWMLNVCLMTFNF